MSFKSQLQLFRDNVRFSIFKSIFDYKAKSSDDFSFSKIDHVIISKLDGKLGDTQVITPFITCLQKYYPNIKISLLCKAPLVAIFKECLNIENIFISEKRRMPYFYARDLCEKIKDVNNGTTLFITTETTYRPQDFYLAHFLKPKYLAGLMTTVECQNINIAKLSNSYHISQFFMDLFKLGHKGSLDESDYFYKELITPNIKNKWQDIIKSKNILAIAPYGAARHRCLSDSTLKYLIDEVKSKTNYDIALLFPKNSNDIRVKFEEYVGDRVVSIPDDISVIDLASIISLCKVMISVDTATVHLASASNLAILGLYASTNEKTLWDFAPYCKKAIKCGVYPKSICEIEPQDLASSLDKFIEMIN